MWCTCISHGHALQITFQDSTCYWWTHRISDESFQCVLTTKQSVYRMWTGLRSNLCTPNSVHSPAGMSAKLQNRKTSCTVCGCLRETSKQCTKEPKEGDFYKTIRPPAKNTKLPHSQDIGASCLRWQMLNWNICVPCSVPWAPQVCQLPLGVKENVPLTLLNEHSTASVVNLWNRWRQCLVLDLT